MNGPGGMHSGSMNPMAGGGRQVYSPLKRISDSGAITTCSSECSSPDIRKGQFGQQDEIALSLRMDLASPSPALGKLQQSPNVALRESEHRTNRQDSEQLANGALTFKVPSLNIISQSFIFSPENKTPYQNKCYSRPSPFDSQFPDGRLPALPPPPQSPVRPHLVESPYTQHHGFNLQGLA